MNKTEKLLSIIDRLLHIVEFEQYKEVLYEEDVVEKPKWLIEVEEFRKSGKPLSEAGGFDFDEEEIDEDREEVTEHVVDNSPKSLKEENEHLNNLIDLICKTFGLEKYKTEKGQLGVSWEVGLIDEISKARKKIKK